MFCSYQKQSRARDWIKSKELALLTCLVTSHVEVIDSWAREEETWDWVALEVQWILESLRQPRPWEHRSSNFQAEKKKDIEFMFAIYVLLLVSIRIRSLHGGFIKYIFVLCCSVLIKSTTELKQNWKINSDEFCGDLGSSVCFYCVLLLFYCEKPYNLI